VPTNPRIGVVKGASTQGGALLISRTFKHGFSLPFPTRSLLGALDVCRALRFLGPAPSPCASTTLALMLVPVEAKGKAWTITASTSHREHSIYSS
jgi:hypothetical protein